MAQIIRCNGTIEEVKPTDKVSFQLKELYYLLDCRVVETFTLASGKLMICDEESKCLDDWEVNLKATELFRAGRMTPKQTEAFLEQKEAEGFFVIDAREDTLDCIAGDVLICEQHQFL